MIKPKDKLIFIIQMINSHKILNLIKTQTKQYPRFIYPRMYSLKVSIFIYFINDNKY